MNSQKNAQVVLNRVTPGVKEGKKMNDIDVGRKERNVHSICRRKAAFESGCHWYSERMSDHVATETIHDRSFVMIILKNDHVRWSIEKGTTEFFDENDGCIKIQRYLFLATKRCLETPRTSSKKRKMNNAGSIAGSTYGGTLNRIGR